MGEKVLALTPVAVCTGWARALLPHTEGAEEAVQDVFGGDFAGDGPKGVGGFAQTGGYEVERQALVAALEGFFEGCFGLGEKVFLAFTRDAGASAFGRGSPLAALEPLALESRPSSNRRRHGAGSGSFSVAPAG